MFSAPCTARSMSAFFSRSEARSASRSLLVSAFSSSIRSGLLVVCTGTSSHW